MILALDVGNSNIYGEVFEDEKVRFSFRMNTKGGATSDEMGIFLCSVLRENGLERAAIRQIAVCTVVPEVVHSLRNACRKYFGISPFFLEPGVKTGLRIKYRNPLEVGADRIANAIAGTHLYPGQDLILIDFGTATTFCAVTAEKDYLGGVIAAGLRISMEALESQTAKLQSVEIIIPETCTGRSTVESIQSGLYFGAVGLVREVVRKITDESFAGRRPRVIGTGGFASLFARAGIFDEEVPDLVLKGLHLALRMNA